MIGYFIANPQSKFYESPVFTKVLNYLQNHSSEVKMSEKNDRLRLIYSNIETLDEAQKVLEAIFE